MVTPLSALSNALALSPPTRAPAPLSLPPSVLLLAAPLPLPRRVSARPPFSRRSFSPLPFLPSSLVFPPPPPGALLIDPVFRRHNFFCCLFPCPQVGWEYYVP